MSEKVITSEIILLWDLTLTEELCTAEGGHKQGTTAVIFFDNKKRWFTLCDGFRGRFLCKMLTHIIK